MTIAPPPGNLYLQLWESTIILFYDLSVVIIHLQTVWITCVFSKPIAWNI